MNFKIFNWINKVPRSRAEIGIAIPYFGNWPEWMDLYLESCRINDLVHWHIFTDQKELPTIRPENVTFHHITLSKFLKKATLRLGLDLQWNTPYKICDLRPGFGVIFEQLFRPYSHWGWADIDVIYGNMGQHIDAQVLDHDCISFSKTHLSGHLCIWRNTDYVRPWFKCLPQWKARMESSENSRLDEPEPSLLPSELKVFAEYSFNTPLSPYLPWTDGSFNFPKEWYWKNGKLTNDIDGKR